MEASVPPLQNVKWTLSCPIAGKVTFPYQFLSSPSDLQLLVKGATDIQSRIPSCEASFEIEAQKRLGHIYVCVGVWVGGVGASLGV